MSTLPGPKDQPQKSARWKSDIIARLEKLERSSELERHKSPSTTAGNLSPNSRSEPESLPSASASAALINRTPLLPSGQDYDSDQVDHTYQGGTSLLQSIVILDRVVGHDTEQHYPSDHSNLDAVVVDHCPFVDCVDFPECCRSDLQILSTTKSVQELECMRAAFRTFFDYPHTHRKL